jgi:hypothetical protein
MSKPVLFLLGVAVGYFAVPWLLEAPARFGRG